MHNLKKHFQTHYLIKCLRADLGYSAPKINNCGKDEEILTMNVGRRYKIYMRSTIMPNGRCYWDLWTNNTPISAYCTEDLDELVDLVLELSRNQEIE